MTVHDEERRPDGGRAFNRGRPVFRVRRNRVGPGLAVGVAAGVVGAVFAASLGGPDPFVVGAALVGVGATVGSFSGRSRSFDVCADPNCKAIIPGAADACPGCGGFVAGRVRRPDDRLAAAEALEGGDDADYGDDDLAYLDAATATDAATDVDTAADPHAT